MDSGEQGTETTGNTTQRQKQHYIYILYIYIYIGILTTGPQDLRYSRDSITGIVVPKPVTSSFLFMFFQETFFIGIIYIYLSTILKVVETFRGKKCGE